MEHHPLEHNQAEKAYFEQSGIKGFKATRSAYRRAVEALNGGLPTWAERAKRGRKPSKAS
ncbi:hypothetical protein PO883_31370 [Massilia sp. DJPM01]|uniref:hypothetical protein n=1 Tax=Massilia sp. DJPM01 TaxID=3024404 RepID=UPI00259E514C|nr:hypothetical protein [Massilia sp. DJPM01]MDM5181681.1 hypothetical protein [Massilia sp. DJPM01]